ncbi:MAG: cell division protein SepF [Schwartzia sp.]|nr:cell division protein SepF [Schwartzia sp. (in: firmicutes)]
MGFMKKFCGKLGISDAEDNEELMEEFEDAEEKAQESSARETGTLQDRKRAAAPSNVIDLQSAMNNGNLRSKMKVVVIEPKSFDDVQQVANSLKEKKPVVINFEHTDAEVAHRIIDFISGTTYAIAGDIKKLGHNVFLCAPSNVSVSYTQERGSISTDMSWLKK